MSDRAAGGSGGNNQPASGQHGCAGGGVAAAAAGLSAAAQQQESPPFVGVSCSISGAKRPWRSTTGIDSKQHQFGGCATRAEAAAAHDLALIWKRLHGKGARCHRAGMCLRRLLHSKPAIACVPVCVDSKHRPELFNFPQLPGDEQLRGRLQGAPGVAALKAVVVDRLQQEWPQQEAGLLAGRAAALAR